MARVVLARSARNDLMALRWPLIDAIDDALSVLAGDPDAGHELQGRLRGLRSLRVGSYRAIYQLAGRNTVRVVAIRHRAVAYRRDPR